MRANTIEASANLFSVLGVGMQLGAGFPADRQLFSRTLVAVISDRLWRTRYGSDPGILGRQISLNDTPEYGQRGAAPRASPAGSALPRMGWGAASPSESPNAHNIAW